MRLFLGVTKDKSWSKEPQILSKMKEKGAGIIFSYHLFRDEIDTIIAKGVHDYFGFDGTIMVDSGAYSAWNSGLKIDIKEYFDFLKQIDTRCTDIFVNLDVVGNPTQSLVNYKWLKLHTNKIKGFLLPVVHYPDRCSYSNDYIGLGGMVNALKINKEGNINDIARWITRQPENRFYHGFGVGSPYNQIIFEDWMYSVDWMGWRRNASVCSVYTPEGSRQIPEARNKPKESARNLSEFEFEMYRPPFIDDYSLLHRKGTEGWYWRAMWNIWYFLVAQEYREIISKSRYVFNVKRKLNRSFNLRSLFE